MKNRVQNFAGKQIAVRESACDVLAAKSAILADLLNKNGFPPVWKREPTFESLVRIIQEQAVSLESANAVFTKIKREIGAITPTKFLAANNQVQGATGFSRKKWETCRICAEKLLKSELNLSPESLTEDTELAEKLLSILGIGRWTVDIYFLLVLQRPDIWPASDRALAVAVSDRLNKQKCLTRVELDVVGEDWRPVRSWAARIFWHDYLLRRNRLHE